MTKREKKSFGGDKVHWMIRRRRRESQSDLPDSIIRACLSRSPWRLVSFSGPPQRADSTLARIIVLLLLSLL